MIATQGSDVLNVNNKLHNKIADEEAFRAYFYLLLSRLLGAVADDELFGVIQNLETDSSAIGLELDKLKALSRSISVKSAAEEYD